MLAASLDQTQPPDAVAVAVMDEGETQLSEAISERCRFTRVDGHRLPLARARNAAAGLAEDCDQLIFLDVDCVPAPDFVERTLEVAAQDRSVMADCRYLDRETPGDLPFGELWARAEKHPARPRFRPTEGAPTKRLDQSTELWSLAFALPRKSFTEMGGFDERFIGYGGEDTDFALRLGEQGTELHYAPQMRAVHQWHEVSVPPLQHFGDIIVNARKFRYKHGQWCMDYWLSQLEEGGYIDWNEERIEVLREPSAHDLEVARQGPLVRFS